MNTAKLKRANVLNLAFVVAAATLAACLVALVGVEKAAEAAFPGVNGKIAFHGLMAEDLNTPDDDSEIFTVNPDGTGLTQVTDNSGINDVAPSWSPDGATIAYTAYNQSDSQQSALYTVSASGGNPNLVIEGASTDAAWSPDGNRIAYSASDGTDSEIYTVSASGGTPTKVTDNTQSDFKPSWSPDGTNIVYTGRSDAGYHDIYKIPVTQQGAANGTPINVTNDTALQDDPDYSPDGSAIAIRLHESSETFSGIATIPIDGGEPTRLVNYSVNLNNIGHPAYAPDGTKIAYNEVVDSNWQIFTVSSSGGTPTAVTDDSSIVAIAPDWQPIDTTPPELHLPENITVNATDANGALVTFEVAATDNADPDPDVTCSPASDSLFPIGTTTVECTATDSSGNTASGSFTVTVKGATEQVTDLKDDIANLNLPGGITASLSATLQQVQSSIEADNIAAALEQLDAFVQQVKAQQRRGTLTPEEAAALISSAEQIKAVLGG